MSNWMDHFSCARLPEVSAETVRLAQQSEIEQQTQEFEANGGKIERVDCVLDQYEKERQERIQKWGKTLHDEPAPRPKPAKKTAEPKEPKEPPEYVSIAEAAEMLGFSYSWLRNRFVAGKFKHLTVKRIGNANHFVTDEIEALIPTHHRDNVPPPHNSVNMTIGDVLEFKRLHNTGDHEIKDLCKRFKISRSTGYRIAKGEQYRNIKLD
jgi:hypothetical protein